MIAMYFHLNDAETALKKFRSLMQHVTLLLLAAVVLAACAGNGSVQRTAELNRVDEISPEDLAAYHGDKVLNAAALERLFGIPERLTRKGASVASKLDERGWLGIAMKIPTTTDSTAAVIEVARVMPGSAAEAAGLRDGDHIVSLDGAPLESKGDKTLLAFRIAISKKRPGDLIKLGFVRDGARLDVAATIKPFPRVSAQLKSHPEIVGGGAQKGQSLLQQVVEKGALGDEFGRLLKEFRNETDKVVSPLIRHTDFNPFRLQEVNYVMTHPTRLPAVARGITDRLHNSFNPGQHDLGAMLDIALDELDIVSVAPIAHPPLAASTSVKASELGVYLERLVNTIAYANAERTAVLSVLTTEEIDFLYAIAPELLTGRWGPGQKERTDAEKRDAEKRDDETRLIRYFSLVLKLDLPRLLNASVAVARAIDIARLPALLKAATVPARFPAGWVVRTQPNLTVIDTPAGRVLIGGSADNTYTDDAMLIIDLGGRDSYLNQAGGSTRKNPFSVVIDATGDDSYSSSIDFAQGAGFLGGGFLVDLAGNDRYHAKSYSQGAGLLGVGLLVDLAGNDQYTATAVAQGAAAFGVGLLADGAGDDRYVGSYFVQGMGYIKGLGVIIESAGNDTYFAGGLLEDFRAPGKSYLSLSQGFGYGMRPWESLVGASGGIGVIAEAEGNDTYVGDYFAQGSSYWFALGILDDRRGHDRYISGRYSQGAGIHMSAGILIDGEGDDNYLADFGVAQGCGHDFGIGVLVDGAGNDRYVGGVLAQGVGNDNGIGLLYDASGNDVYQIGSSGQGRGNFEAARDVGSFGFLFDLGGADSYSAGRRNNGLGYTGQWGIQLDGETGHRVK